ncbi:trypsin-like peptidase domain-containing protein [Parvularcula sp. LCG005]|uniref:trypsin-like peptidase domain-containing protein n=1 Tax=Parvularcula sp. LCG005 TaxID=3078805 RepID=UPI002943DE4E|nr:trypsin-like peptidase domain-containing protein [Parvularcula sp. LCG005]WOI52278.1 trypsin-like peptidase domain-containing protein [Parvularcula sp. LCG005]
MRHLLAGLFATASVFAFAPEAVSRGAPDSFAELVEDVMPAVVNISTGQKVIGFKPGDSSGDAVSLGSGFIVSTSGIVVTNNHVIDNADTITVTLEGGEEFPAILKAVDRETDLAVLEIQADGRKFPAVKFGNSDSSRVGDWVVAIGQPFGLGGSVSAGIVSARNRNIESGLYDDYIQTDAAINRGNSGGPLFNMSGEVIGVNTVIYSQTGGSVGVGFAVPGNLASRVVSQLIEFGQTQRGYLGVLLEDVTTETQTRLSLDSMNGALVAGLPTMGGPAQIAGIAPDDVIIKFDGKTVKERRDLTRYVADTPVGATVPVVLVRDGKKITVRVTIARRETMTAMSTGTVETAGLTLQTPTDDVKAMYGLPDQTDGVIITHVDVRTDASQSLQPGDVILEIGWDKAVDAEDVEDHLNRLRAARSGPVQILVQRGDKLFYAHINP